MAVLPPIKVCRHIPITPTFFLLFTKDLKGGHIIERNSWIDRKVTGFVIQAHHIPAVGVLVIVIYKSVNWYYCFWNVGGAVVIIYV